MTLLTARLLIGCRGRTQIAAGSRTVLGIAGNFNLLCRHLFLGFHTLEGPSRLVNQITGRLRLL